MKNSIHQLCDELSKLTSFLNPTPVKTAASTTIKFLNQKDTKFPLQAADSPIILAFSMIFTNSKTLKNFSFLLLRLIDCIRNNVFDSDALLVIMNLICSNVMQFDVELSLKLLQYTTSSILQNFPDLYIINSFFSTALAFLDHPDSTVSETAYASFQQMLALFIDTILNFKDFENTNYKNYLKYCQEKYGHIISSFKNSFYVILHLIFCDLSNLSENLKTNWLFMIKTSQEMLFVLLAEIVQTYGDLIKADQQLLSSFRISIFDDVKYPTAIPYLITYMSSFLDVDKTVGSNLFSQYFQQIQFNSELNFVPVLFFHYFALQKNDIMLKYFTLWNGAVDLFVPLICTLMNFISEPSIPLTFSMKQWKYSDVLQDQKKFEQTAIYEITFAIIESFKKSSESSVLEFISQSSNALVFTVMSGIKYSDISSFDVPQQALFDLCQILNKLSLLSKVDKFEQLDEIFFEFDDSRKKLYLYDEKVKLWPKFVSQFIVSAPQICEDRWKYFVNAAIIQGISPTFAKKFSDITTMDILFALLAIKPFPGNYISEFIFDNISRFELLYPILEAFIDKMFQKNRFDEAVLQLFLSLMKNAFSQKTEIELLRTAATFLQSEISIPNKSLALQQLKSTISISISEIKEGWISLFEAIQPSNFQNDEKLLRIGYDILHFVTSNFVSTIYFAQFIELIFLYIEQDMDESISILGFDLLSKIEKHVENWDFILIQFARIFTDSRQVIADTACTNFFDILQNREISPKIFMYLFDKGFYEILDILGQSSIVLPHFLNLTAKYICNEWEFLLEHPTFLNQFVPLIIELQRKTTNQIVDFYLHFYSSPVVISTSPDIENLLCHSISSRIGKLAAYFEFKNGNTNNNVSNETSENQSNDANSTIINQIKIDDYETSLKKLNSIADLVFRIFNQRVVKISPKNWMPMIAMLLPAVPLSAIQSITQVFQIIPKLFFNEDGNGSNESSKINYSFDEKCFVVESLCSISKNLKNNDKRKMVIDIIYEIVKKQPHLIFSCNDVLSLNESIPFIKILSGEIEYVSNELSEKAIQVNSTDSYYNSTENNNFNEKNVDKIHIFECLIESLSHQETKQRALEQIVDIFPSLQLEIQQQFIFIHSNDSEILITIWKSFFDINSTMFNIEVFNNCNKLVTQALKILIDNWKVEENENLISFYKYLKTVKVPSSVGDKQDDNDENPLIMDLMNSILSKVNMAEETVLKE